MEFKDREDLVKPQKRAKIDEHSSSESFVCVQQQTQQVEDQCYPATPDVRNTLDAKLASIFPTQFPGYFQNMGHPLKSAAHCVQGAMQSVVDDSKGLLQSREVNGGYRKLSTAQPFSSQSINRGQMQMCLSTAVASYNIGSRVANPWHLPYINENVRVTMPFTSTQTRSENQFLSVTASDSGHNIPTSLSTCTSSVNSHLRLPEHYHTSSYSTTVPELQPRNMSSATLLPRRATQPLARAPVITDTSLGVLETFSQEAQPRTVSRLKVIFSQRKFVYEFPLHSSDVTAQENQPNSENSKYMACIEVPFMTVVGINITRILPTEVVIEVNTVPTMWLGKQIMQHRPRGVVTKHQYNTLNSVDLTNGQLTNVPYHKLTVSSATIATHLMKFDPKFSALLRIPVVINTNKSLPKPIKEFQIFSSTKRKRTHKDSDSTPDHLQSSTCPLPLSHCSCSAGCSTKRCSCVRENIKCQDCRCGAPCKNPLNIMAEFGVDVDKATSDICLMQKLPKIFDLRAHLRERSVQTPCCDSAIPLKTCCGVVVECPECETEYRYSWCTGSFCDEENRPRNHCEVCQSCRDYRDQHCSRCNKCYFAGSCGDFPCPCNVKYGRNTMKFL
ncbi:unnamed protein product [Porites evermanni]|uniref:Tesmin/TSO1-like CXC domain-containing protein n=1 Tax=Porites evermanni TaxID=104178 RepID=A0ABN8LPL8_9CNID|nr:unnamed protein product [Porites evermanni]